METDVIENIHFVGISRDDFRLLAALGCVKKVPQSASVSGYQVEVSPVLVYIKQLRAKAVNALLNQAIRAVIHLLMQKPMMRVRSSKRSVRLTANRFKRKLNESASVPARFGSLRFGSVPVRFGVSSCLLQCEIGSVLIQSIRSRFRFEVSSVQSRFGDIKIPR